MKDTLKLAGVLVGGYVIGRLKKGRTAVRLAMWLTGKSVNPRELAREGLGRLARSPEGAQLIAQLKGPMLAAGREVVVGTLESQMNAVTEALAKRTQAVGAASEAAAGAGKAAGKAAEGGAKAAGKAAEGGAKAAEQVLRREPAAEEQRPEEEEHEVPAQARREPEAQAKQPEQEQQQEEREPAQAERSEEEAQPVGSAKGSSERPTESRSRD